MQDNEYRIEVVSDGINVVVEGRIYPFATLDSAQSAATKADKNTFTSLFECEESSSFCD